MKILPRSLLFPRAVERLARRVLRYDLNRLYEENRERRNAEDKLRFYRSHMEKNGVRVPNEEEFTQWKMSEAIFGGEPMLAMLREAGHIEC